MLSSFHLARVVEVALRRLGALHARDLLVDELLRVLDLLGVAPDYEHLVVAVAGAPLRLVDLDVGARAPVDVLDGLAALADHDARLVARHLDEGLLLVGVAAAVVALGAVVAAAAVTVAVTAAVAVAATVAVTVTVATSVTTFCD